MKDLLPFATAHDMADLILQKKATAEALTHLYLDRIKKYNHQLHCMVVIDEAGALATARVRDRELKEGIIRGSLHGVPVSVKESFNLKGHKTTVNFPLLKNNVATKDAVVVQRLRDAGAVILGKSNVPTLLSDNQTRGPLFPTANNPWDTSLTTGGSTGGGAAAIAAGLTTFEIGTDIGGSIRNPASFCGIFGLKPTENQYIQSGHVPPLPGSKGGYISMASIGPLARSMGDIALAWQVIHQAEWKYLNSLPVHSMAPKYGRLSDYKVGWFDHCGQVVCSPSAQNVLHTGLEKLAKKGLKIHEIKLDERWLQETFEVWSSLFAFVSGQQAPWILRQIMKIKFSRQSRGTHLRGLKNLKKSLGMDFRVFSRTLAKRQRIIAELIGLFQEYDFIISPTSPGPAFPHNPKHKPIAYEGQRYPYPDYNFPFTFPYNACGNPALVLPGGVSAQKLPIGIQIAGPHFSEHELIHFGLLAEQAGLRFHPPDGYS